MEGSEAQVGLRLQVLSPWGGWATVATAAEALATALFACQIAASGEPGAVREGGGSIIGEHLTMDVIINEELVAGVMAQVCVGGGGSGLIPPPPHNGLMPPPTSLPTRTMASSPLHPSSHTHNGLMPLPPPHTMASCPPNPGPHQPCVMPRPRTHLGYLQ